MAEDGALPEGILTKGLILDPKIWNKFPEELLEKVLVYLPLHSLVRARSVCRKWNAYVFSKTFTKLRAEISPQKPWIVMTSTENSMFAYDSG